MYVMYVTDENYADIAAVSISSLLDTNKGVEHICIYVVADHISFGSKSAIKKLVEEYGRKIIFLNKSNLSIWSGKRPETGKWPENTFIRLFTATIFKEFEEVERILYLDCDTLITGNLQNLWETELNGYIGAGVCESMGKLHKKAIGIDGQEYYFNSGVLLLDVRKWRSECIEDGILDYINSIRRSEYPDEAALNAVLSGKIKKLSPKYNLTSLSVYYSEKDLKIFRKSPVNYTERERQEALDKPYIIHFTSTFLDFRPWQVGCCHPYAELWITYAKQFAYRSGNRFTVRETNIKKKLIVGLIKIIPKKILLQITGFLHAYVKPLPYIIRNVSKV